MRCDILGEIHLKFEIADGKNHVELWGEDFSTCQEGTSRFGANFGANFGESFGNFVSTFTTFLEAAFSRRVVLTFFRGLRIFEFSVFGWTRSEETVPLHKLICPLLTPLPDTKSPKETAKQTEICKHAS